VAINISHHDDEKGAMATAYRRWREIYPPVNPTPES
jgi:hypothetical protein